MNMLKTLVALAVAGAGASAAQAQVQTLDFNDLAYYDPVQGDDSFHLLPAVLDYHGYTFTKPTPTDFYGLYGKVAALQADPDGGAAILDNPDMTDANGVMTTMTRTDGGSFDFLSMDVEDSLVGAFGGLVATFPPEFWSLFVTDIAFTFHRASGDTVMHFGMDYFEGFQTFTFDQYGVESVSWTTAGAAGTATSFNFDNLVVSTAAAVPEPGTYALMFAGLSALAFVSRRRRRR